MQPRLSRAIPGTAPTVSATLGLVLPSAYPTVSAASARLLLPVRIQLDAGAGQSWESTSTSTSSIRRRRASRRSRRASVCARKTTERLIRNIQVILAGTLPTEQAHFGGSRSTSRYSTRTQHYRRAAGSAAAHDLAGTGARCRSPASARSFLGFTALRENIHFSMLRVQSARIFMRGPAAGARKSLLQNVCLIVHHSWNASNHRTSGDKIRPHRSDRLIRGPEHNTPAHSPQISTSVRSMDSGIRATDISVLATWFSS